MTILSRVHEFHFDDFLCSADQPWTGGNRRQYEVMRRRGQVRGVCHPVHKSIQARWVEFAEFAYLTLSKERP